MTIKSSLVIWYKTFQLLKFFSDPLYFMIISNGIVAIATVVIAYYAWQTKKSQDNFQEQLSDLYKGIILATLLSSNTDSSQITQFTAKFKEHYDGKTPIFKN